MQTLSVPALILPSVQVNMRAGQLPPVENDGFSYLKIPHGQAIKRILLQLITG